MTSRSEKSTGQVALSIEVTPTSVAAGAEFGLLARVSCTPACDLASLAVVIRSEDGACLGEIALSHFDGATNSTDDLVLRAPLSVGVHRWTASIEAFETDDAAYPAVSEPIALQVEPHAVTVNVWDLASALTSGSAARMHVGVRCACGCSLAGRSVTIHDELGNLVASARIADEVWPRTEALYYAQVQATVDADVGPHRWKARFSGAGLEPSHGDGQADFSIRVVPAGEHLVQVHAVDGDGATPLPGAIVTMHPFRAVADHRGIAELRVPKGSYTLFVSARRHVSNRAVVEVDGDLVTQSQLAVEIRPERM